MSFYSGLAATVTRLISTYGRPVTLRFVEPGAYDAATMAKLSDVVKDVFGAAVVAGFDAQDINGTTILNTDKRLVTGPIAYSRRPRPGDFVVIAGEVFGIVKCDVTEPGAVALSYTLHVR